MVIIHKNPNGDTRTAPKDVSFEQFQISNDMHKQDVKNVMNELAFYLMQQGDCHDWTKKVYERMFYDNFVSTINNGTDFVNDQWYQLHIKEEKHHPNSFLHEDINLLNILEVIADCVCAGKARSGEIRDLNIEPEILQKALENTIKMVDSITSSK